MKKQKIIPFPVKSKLLTGTSYGELKKHADLIFALYKGKGDKKVCVRSAFFKKQKVFFDHFWKHMFQKPKRQRMGRLKLLLGAIELISKSRNKPSKKINPKKRTEVLYRFYGITNKSKSKFVVQIKQNINTKRLQCISIFPWK
ncbi:MAG: hypothetical protein ABFQ62_01540 [Patescibacteria group bacterium]